MEMEEHDLYSSDSTTKFTALDYSFYNLKRKTILLNYITRKSIYHKKIFIKKFYESFKL